MTEYPRFHQNRVNLLVHVATVPMFVVGTVMVAVSLLRMDWIGAGLDAIVPLGAYAVQGLGHSRESNRPIPFAGPGDFVYRLFAEQFYRFPRFVVTGGFARAWRGAAP